MSFHNDEENDYIFDLDLLIILYEIACFVNGQCN